MKLSTYNQTVREEVKPRFRGRKQLRSRARPIHPASLELEYRRLAGAYMVALNKSIAEHLPALHKAIVRERHGSRYDSDADIRRLIDETFRAISSSFDRRVLTLGLERRLANLANLSRNYRIREWKRIVRRTLGVNILEDYYRGDFFRHMMRTWTRDNVNLITRVPQRTLSQMRDIIEDGYAEGRLMRDIGDEIRDAYGMGKRHAQNIARDQMAKLNADMTEAQHKDAGVERFVWSTSTDERVRESHVSFHGKQFSWSDPPMDYYSTKSRGNVPIGRTVPGRSIMCRCVALPVFDIANLSLPWISQDAQAPVTRAIAAGST